MLENKPATFRTTSQSAVAEVDRFDSVRRTDFLLLVLAAGTGDVHTMTILLLYRHNPQGCPDVANSSGAKDRFVVPETRVCAGTDATAYFCAHFFFLNLLPSRWQKAVKMRELNWSFVHARQMVKGTCVCVLLVLKRHTQRLVTTLRFVPFACAVRV